jgi:hypothetical protein
VQIIVKKLNILGLSEWILMKINGTTQENDGTWRIKTNAELETIIKKKNI